MQKTLAVADFIRIMPPNNITAFDRAGGHPPRRFHHPSTHTENVKLQLKRGLLVKL